MVSYILIIGYSILLFMNPLNFVAVILKVLLVNLLAALNFSNVFKNKKNVWKIKKMFKNVKNVTKIKKNVKQRFLHPCVSTPARAELRRCCCCWLRPRHHDGDAAPAASPGPDFTGANWALGSCPGPSQVKGLHKKISKKLLPKETQKYFMKLIIWNKK